MDLDIGKHLVVLGMNHSCSGVLIRERVYFAQAQIPDALSVLKNIPDVNECLILSTCNRIEIYAVVTNTSTAYSNLLKFVADYKNVEIDKLKKHTYFFNCNDAVRHFYDVIASLDSLVIGEGQIVSQVKNAYRTAWENGTTGPFINKLFHFAITAGKRVRTETEIGAGIVSIASAAVDLARNELGGFEGKKALIIGAGEMGKLTAKHLQNFGVCDITFTNRTGERAREIASEFGGKCVEFSKWPDTATTCDVIVSSTGSPHRIITLQKATQIMNARNNQFLVFIDVAMPRDIDPEVETLSGVKVYSIDNLIGVVEENSQMRKNEIVKAESIISEEVKKYYFWYNNRKVQSVLVELKDQFSQIRDMELKRYSSVFSSLPEPISDEIKKFAVSLTDKFIHAPLTVLKEHSASNDCEEFVNTITELFKLDIKNE